MKISKLQELQNQINERLTNLIKENEQFTDKFHRNLLSDSAYRELINQNNARQDELRKTLVMLVTIRHK